MAKSHLYLFIFLASFACALITTPIIRRLALKWGVVDRPNARKIHIEPIPLFGGLSIAFAFLLVFSLFGSFNIELLTVLFASLIIIVVGIWDDIKSISPFLKLSAQILACWLVIIFGTKVSFTNNPNIDIPITFLWVVGITNAFNLLDNMDGLSVGIAGIASSFFLILSAMNGQFLIASLSAALAGSCFGFLRYNFKPAQIFMGDTGSMFLGFLLAVIGLKLRFTNTSALTFAIPIVILSLPIFDTSLVIISRMVRGVKVSEGGKDHTSHRLVKIGLSQGRAVLLLYIIGSILGLCGVALSLLTTFLSYVTLGILLLLMIVGIALFEKIKV
ncbi:MAG: MraY family glycosyltransferase [bacterium]|nr:MraY family glycosyltransferase [bacterium]